MVESLMVLLGAGASYGFAPSTKDLTKALVSWRANREPDASRDDAAFLPRRGNDKRRGLFAALYGLMARRRRYFSDPKRHLHFERLIHVAELLGSHFPLDGREGADEFRSLLAPFVQPREGLERWHLDGAQYHMLAEEACWFILDTVREYCDRSDPSGSAIVSGLESLAERALLRCVSLNYDDVALAAKLPSPLRFYDGFEEETDRPYRVFRPQFPWPVDRHSFCQLHGSILFGSVITDGDLHTVARFPDRAAARTASRGSGSGRHFQDGHEGPSVPMVTGMRKADKLLSRPFGTYAHVFREQALSTNRWLIIGYGGGDDHINEILSQARRNWLQRGESHRVVVVDKVPEYKDQEEIRSEELTWDNRLPPVFHIFSDEMKRREWFETRLRPNAVTPITKSLGFVGDGTDWAMGPGLEQVARFLAL